MSVVPLWSPFLDSQFYTTFVLLLLCVHFISVEYIVNHLGEAQAIRLALRPEHQNDILLLDELAARTVAKQSGIKLSGFPGTLLMAVQAGLLSPEELRERLERCRQLGTHYSVLFIEQVYEMAKQKQR